MRFKKPARVHRRAAIATYCLLAAAPTVHGADTLDTVSVTATRSERATKEVPEAITVVDEQRLQQAPMFNIKDVLSEIPGVLINNSTGSYSARVVIRGAGLKANYGIREIMMLRDGVPITDPDSFTRLDFIDTQDIEQIEVTRGPGNLYASGSAGGTIQIISKSVFDMAKNNVKVGAGTEGMSNVHFRYAAEPATDQALAFTGSRRVVANDWRDHSEFDTTQFSLKHGLLFGDNHVWENEISYTEANSDFPGSLDDADFANYLATGTQTDNNNAFDHTGRYSKILFLNSRMELDMGSYTLKPKLYYNNYSHFHPVTGQISSVPGSQIFGADLELGKPHQIGAIAAEFNGGVTVRADVNDDSRRYAYADVITADGSGNPFASRILATRSNRPGALLEIADERNVLYGFFVEESLHLNDRLTLDVGTRIDQANMYRDIDERFSYSYATGQYLPGAGVYTIDRDFLLFSPKAGLTYKLTPTVNAFLSVAQADQVPFGSELEQNPNLDKARIRNIEVGLKGRAEDWTLDASVYYTRGEDEVVATRENGTSTFSNAGETEKIGLELAASFQVHPYIDIGANYAYSDYTYLSFTEVVSAFGPPVAVDRSGNTLPYVPRHKYTLFADYRHPQGYQARISADSWGSYWMDNANTEKYGGYDFVTSLFLGYEKGSHRIGLNVDNLFDKRYATEVTKDTRGTRAWEPGAPRSFLASYRYAFDKP